MLRLFSVLFSCLLSWHVLAENAPSAPNTDPSLANLVKQLPKTKLNKMAPLLEKISQTKHPKTRDLLQYLMDGELYYIKSGRAVVRAQAGDNKQYILTDVLGEKIYQPVKKSKISKVKTNNRLRGTIRSLIAQIELTSPDKIVRLEAVKQLLDNPNDEGFASIEQLVETEQDKDVLDLMQITLQLRQLQSSDHQQKMAAILSLKDSLEPKVKNTFVKQLNALPEEPQDDETKALKVSLKNAITTIEDKRDIYAVVENIFFGLSLGSVLLLAAIGLAITFGVMGVINMAHGEMIMLGAYTTYVVQLVFPHLIEYSLLIAIPAAFLVSGSVGIIIERCVIRFLKGRPLETLLATFGISLILQQLVRTVFSPLNRQVATPEWMSGSWQINPVFSLTFNRLYIILFSLMVFFALLMILKKSSLGLHVRAVSQNRDMARALSIKSDWVDAITFGLGSGIAGVAGVVLSQLTNVGPNLGQAYIIDSFLVVVFGGVGNLWGTLVAAMSLGSINKFLEPITGSVLANIIVLVGLVLFIQKRPKGLFPQKGRAAD
jgi:urea transport system permease protein